MQRDGDPGSCSRSDGCRESRRGRGRGGGRGGGGRGGGGGARGGECRAAYRGVQGDACGADGGAPSWRRSVRRSARGRGEGSAARAARYALLTTYYLTTYHLLLTILLLTTYGPLGTRRMHLEHTQRPGTATAAITPPEPHARPVYGTVALRLLLTDLELLIAPGQPAWRRSLWRARLRGWLPPLLLQCTAASRRALEVIADPLVGSGWKGGPKAGVAAGAAEGMRPDPQAGDTPIDMPVILVAGWCAARDRTADAATPNAATAARRSRRRCAFYTRGCHVWQGLLGRRRGRRGAAVQDGGAGRVDGHYVLAVRRTRLKLSLTLG